MTEWLNAEGTSSSRNATADGSLATSELNPEMVGRSLQLYADGLERKREPVRECKPSTLVEVKNQKAKTSHG